MMYFYTKVHAPDLDILEATILASSLIVGIYIYLRWDAEDTLLKVELNRELDSEEKIVLDNLVSSV